MNVSIVVVNYNGGPTVVRNLRAMLESAGPSGAELVVVDNASTDGSPYAVRSAFPEARLVEAPANSGYAAGVNLGLSKARGQLLVIMNPDVSPRGDAVARLARSAGSTRALVGGAVLAPSGRVSRNCFRALPVLSDITREALFVPPRTRRERDASLPDGVFRTDVVSGSVMALTRETLGIVGPLDEQYFLYNEDVEWCTRAAAKGVAVCVDDGARFEHAGGASTRASEGPAFAARVLSDFQYFCEVGGADPESVRRLWRRRLSTRTLVYRVLAAFGVGDGRLLPRRRAAVYSILARSIGLFDWAPSSEGANAHPSRILRTAGVSRRTDRPTIVQLIPNMDHGGAQRLVEQLVRGPLADRFRFEVVCLTHEGRIGAALRRDGVPVHVVGMDGWRSWRDWLLAADHAALMECDLVHSHLLPADLAAWLGFGRRVLRVSTKHSVDRWMRGHHRLLERLALAGARDVLAVSDDAARSKSYLGPAGMLPPVVPSPPAVQPATSPAPVFPPGRPGRLGIVGRLHPVKRVDLFLRVAAVVEREAPGEFEFRIIGEGGEEASLRSLADELGIADRVEFRGAVDDVAGELDDVDVVFMVSDYEGLGLTILETIARGRVPIVRAAPGAREALPPALSCCLVEGDAPEVLAMAALDVRARTSFYTERVAAAGRTRATDGSYALAHGRVYTRALETRAASRRVRVLHLITRLIVGGAQENTIASVARVDNDRYDSELWCGPQTGSEGSLIEDARSRGIVVRILPNLVREIDPWRDAAVTLALVRLLARGRFDVVHTHSSKAGIVGRFAARLARVPHIVHTVHGWGFHEHMHPLLRGFYVALERIMQPWTNPLVSVSERTTRVGLEASIGDESSYRLIRSGIPLSRFRADEARRRATRDAFGFGERSPVVGSVGRLSPQKNPHDFLRAADLLRRERPDVRFLYVGDGPLREGIEAEAARMGLGESLVLAGIRGDVPDLLRAIDVFVLTSLWEGLPRVVLQALATGVPVVAYDVAGIREVVVSDVNGFLVEPGEPEQVARHVARIISDEALRERMGRAAVERFHPSFSEAGMIGDLEDLYSELTED
ncbi:MAG: glycosyltransferase [Candidatus Eisenbacteria bacterium]